MAHVYKFKVYFGDTDPAGIVFYPNFYRWMDEATHEFFGAKYMPSTKLLNEEKIGYPVLEANCQFRTPLYFEDEVEVHTKVIELKEKIFKLEHVFKRGETLIAEGYTLRAWASTKGETIKAVPIPEEVREAMQS